MANLLLFFALRPPPEAADATRKREVTDEVVAVTQSSGQSPLDRDKPGSGRYKTSYKRTRRTNGILRTPVRSYVLGAIQQSEVDKPLDNCRTAGELAKVLTTTTKERIG